MRRKSDPKEKVRKDSKAEAPKAVASKAPAPYGAFPPEEIDEVSEMFIGTIRWAWKGERKRGLCYPSCIWVMMIMMAVVVVVDISLLLAGGISL